MFINPITIMGCVCGAMIYIVATPRYQRCVDKWHGLVNVCSLSNTGVGVYKTAISIIMRYPYEILKRKLTARCESAPLLVVVPYRINGVEYKMMTKHRKGPCSILVITDQDGVDVTDIVLPYMGPLHNWHGHDFKPQDLGYKRLTFLTSDFVEETFM